MARTVEDVALFLDTMAGFCPLDPMTFDAPSTSFSESIRKAPPKRAYASTIGGAPVDKETRDIAAKAMEYFRSMGTEVDEIVIEIEDLESTFLALRSTNLLLIESRVLKNHRDQIKKDIIWNTELGLSQRILDLALAQSELGKNI